jgi:hypothetical protein
VLSQPSPACAARLRPSPAELAITGRRGSALVYKKSYFSLAFVIKIFYYWEQVGEATPTKARLTSNNKDP